MELKLASQLKLNRERLHLSQEEVAHRIFVSRQTMSSWETGKTYPDVQSLLLLSNLFGVSIDELVKGDVETMKEVLSEDARKMGKLTWAAIIALIVGIIAILALSRVFHAPSNIGYFPVGFFFGLPILIVATVIASLCEYRIEQIKKKHNLVALREISAFMDGEDVTVNESAFSRVHPKASNVVKFLCGAVFGLVVAFIVEVILMLLR